MYPNQFYTQNKSSRIDSPVLTYCFKSLPKLANLTFCGGRADGPGFSGICCRTVCIVTSSTFLKGGNLKRPKFIILNIYFLTSFAQNVLEAVSVSIYYNQDMLLF